MSFERFINMAFIAVVSIGILTLGSVDGPSITADDQFIPDDPYVIADYSYASREDYTI